MAGKVLRYSASVLKRDPLVLMSSLVIVGLASYMLSRPDIANVMVGTVQDKVLIGLALTAALLALIISVANQVHVNRSDANKGCAIPQTFLMSGAALMLLVPVLAVPDLQGALLTMGPEVAIAAAVLLCSIAAICIAMFVSDLSARLDTSDRSYRVTDGIQGGGIAPSVPLPGSEFVANLVTRIGSSCSKGQESV